MNLNIEIPNDLLDQPRFAEWDDGLVTPDEQDRSFGSDFPRDLIIPKAEWKDAHGELVEAHTSAYPDSPHPPGCLAAEQVPFCYHQSPESSCVLNATCMAFMIRWSIQVGPQYLVVLSPMAAYYSICSYQHSGSRMWDAMTLSTTKGLLPASTHGQDQIFDHTYHENAPYSRRKTNDLPPGHATTCADFIVIEWLRIDNEEQFVSALLRQFPVVYGRQGHSICGEDLVFRRNDPVCRSRDSYGWHNRDGTGHIYDSRRMMNTGGAWACRRTSYPSKDLIERLEKLRLTSPVETN